MRYKRYEKYKDSGIEWIGEVPEHWEVNKLKKSVISLKNGIWGEEPENDENDIYCIRIIDFDRNNFEVEDKYFTIRNLPKEKQMQYLLDKGDLLIEKSGGGEKQPVGFVALYNLDKKAIYANFIAKMILDKGCADSNYFKYLHSTIYAKRVNVRSIKQTTGIQNLDTNYYLQEYVVYPPINEQVKIANYLDKKTSEIDSLIQDKEKLISLLEEKRQAIITEAVTKGLNPNVKMKDSGIEWIGEIPEHWEVKKLKYIVRNGKEGIKIGPFGSSLKLDDMDENNPYKVYGQENIINNDFTRGNRFITQEKFNEMRGYELFSGDIVISMMGTIGKCKVIPLGIQPGIMDSHLIRLRTNNEVMLPKFFEHLIDNANYIKEQMNCMSKGSIMSGLNSSIIKEIILVVPSVMEQKRIVDFLDKKTSEIDSLINDIKQQIQKLKEYRQSLIFEAVTGKIDLRDITLQ
ncbi:restriction endonuclease subunit S [Caloramator sp. ALD01]|uniref:restriction endonuclease subunit S n=1 Tax=Caloramator sp. ALD01 TaxID=1031288 RepID=UPI0003F592FF|nr:restriction endonuclease subunit S [Caloramator sp. ALD01]